VGPEFASQASTFFQPGGVGDKDCGKLVLTSVKR
jgi:hypothetical protein